jgi:hypothetical protein
MKESLIVNSLIFYQSSWTDFAENLSLMKKAEKHWLPKLVLARSSLIWMQMNQRGVHPAFC